MTFFLFPVFSEPLNCLQIYYNHAIAIKKIKKTQNKMKQQKKPLPVKQYFAVQENKN